VRRDADGVCEGCREFEVGTGPDALLLIHGFGDTPAAFRKLAPALAEGGFTCRAMRLPGFGEPVHGTRACRMAWLQAIEREVAALRARHRSVWIVAHSLGCTLSIEYIANHPEAVDGLVFLTPLIEVSRRRAPLKVPGYAWFLLGQSVLRFTQVFENFYPVNSHGAEAREHSTRTPFVHRSVYRELFECVKNIRGGAGAVRCPLLVLLSPRDRVICNRAAVRFFSACASRRKDLRFLHNAGHAMPVDPCWPDVAEAIGRFASADATGADATGGTGDVGA
jgi:alpha-beta hydrolase superfamily lysophospholipase